MGGVGTRGRSSMPDRVDVAPHCRYEQSEWGWKEREKREEMNDERAWYLLARDGDSAPVAFSHFRFDVECGEEVLYW